MSLLQKIIIKDDSAVFAGIEKVRQEVDGWTAQFSKLNAHVASLESRVDEVRQAYFADPTVKTFDALVEAVDLARQSREVFSSNVAVNAVMRTRITDTDQVRGLLSKGCKIVHNHLVDLAKQHDAEERTRCAQFGIEFGGSPTATAIQAKADRLENELARLDNPDRPCWPTERVLASV